VVHLFVPICSCLFAFAVRAGPGGGGSLFAPETGAVRVRHRPGRGPGQGRRRRPGPAHGHHRRPDHYHAAGRCVERSGYARRRQEGQPGQWCCGHLLLDSDLHT